MLLRGKYDVLINVTWDCFDQYNFYISRINIIEWNNMIYVLFINPFLRGESWPCKIFPDRERMVMHDKH